MAAALDHLAEVADEVADDQHEIARSARRMEALREDGWSWSRIFESGEGTRLVEVVRRSARLLADESVRLTSVLAAELTGEGRSRREIARWLGVTHQRVSALVERTRTAVQD